MLGRFPFLAKSAPSFAWAAASWAGCDRAGSMLSLVRTALLSTDCAEALPGTAASNRMSAQDNVLRRAIRRILTMLDSIKRSHLVLLQPAACGAALGRRRSIKLDTEGSTASGRD